AAAGGGVPDDAGNDTEAIQRDRAEVRGSRGRLHAHYSRRDSRWGWREGGDPGAGELRVQEEGEEREEQAGRGRRGENLKRIGRVRVEADLQWDATPAAGNRGGRFAFREATNDQRPGDKKGGGEVKSRRADSVMIFSQVLQRKRFGETRFASVGGAG